MEKHSDHTPPPVDLAPPEQRTSLSLMCSAQFLKHWESVQVYDPTSDRPGVGKAIEVLFLQDSDDTRYELFHPVTAPESEVRKLDESGNAWPLCSSGSDSPQAERLALKLAEAVPVDDDISQQRFAAIRRSLNRPPLP